MKCRCGATPVNGRCPNQTPSAFIRHDLIAQRANEEGFPNWTVLPEGTGFRAYAGSDRLDPLFATEEEAWEKLEEVFWQDDEECEQEQEEEQDLV